MAGYMTLHENTLSREQWEQDGLKTALCSLPLAIEPRVVQDDYTLTFSYPLKDIVGQEMRNDRLVCADGQLYRITRCEIDDAQKPLKLNVFARHILYDLEDKDIVNIETSETTPGGIPQLVALQQILEGTPFTAGTVNTDVVLDYLDILQKDALWALKEQVLHQWGGELVVDNWTISILKERGQDNGVHLREGKNISGVSYSETLEGVITRLHIIGYQGANIESINDGKDYIDSPYIGSYANIKEGYVTFSDDDLPEDLMQKGEEYLRTVEKPRVTITVDVAEAKHARKEYAVLDYVELGDTVQLYHSILKAPVSIRVTSRTYNPVTRENIQLIISNDSENLYTLLARASQNNDIIKMITDRNGRVRAESLRGVIDLMVTRMYASGAYTDAQVIEDKGALFENTDPESAGYGALYIGPGIFAIANAKNEDGGWNWRTFGTGEGFAGTEVIAGTVTTNQLSSEVGQNLDISSNQAIRSAVQQIDEAREELIGINQTTIEQAWDAITLAVQQERARAQAVEDEIKSFTDSAKTYFRFDVDGLHIGRMDSPFTIVLSPEKISFLQDGVEVAFIMHNKLYINSAQILQMLTLGNPTTGYVDKKIVPGGEIALWRAN